MFFETLLLIIFCKQTQLIDSDTLVMPECIFASFIFQIGQHCFVSKQRQDANPDLLFILHEDTCMILICPPGVTVSLVYQAQ